MDNVRFAHTKLSNLILNNCIFHRVYFVLSKIKIFSAAENQFSDSIVDHSFIDEYSEQFFNKDK
jgi:hypothetical protein